MARSLNKVQLIGRLGKDPEMRYTANGSALTTFTVATNRTWINGDGTPHEEVEWHSVTAWGTLAETTNQFLVKGRLVYIEGRLQTRAWEGEDGVRHSRTEIIAEDVIFLDRQPSEEEPPEDPPPAAAAPGKKPRR
jgi:single-strand DNA-binding protein